jgi:O-methyltransferase
MSPKKFASLLVEDRALAARMRLLRLAGLILVPSYRFKWPQLDWWRDREFTRFLHRFGELRVLNTDRKWTIHQLLRLVAHLPGDTAECGVFRGATSYLICSANGASGHPKTHHLFDSFEGLSQPTAADGVHWSRGDLRFSKAKVERALSQFQDVSFHPGWIPSRFDEVAGRTFSFVHIDVDLADPTRHSLEFFYPRMTPGGIIVCDDYGFTTCPGATAVIDAFLADKQEKMLALPDGGGFLIIKTPTAPPARL